MNDASDRWQQNVERKIDRLLSDIDFIKNRVTTYLGSNEALTYLIDETPIFVNTDDLGCPINFIDGGTYEEDYFRVLHSFRKPNLPMLDIGANLGVYSLRFASYTRGDQIYAFEPIPKIRNLLSRSIFLNGFSDRISLLPYAVADVNGEAVLSIPSGHAGGASLESSSNINNVGISVKVKRLDDFFPENFICGLIKLDIEGQEINALRGMRNILTRSSYAVVMFEKLAANGNFDSQIYDYFEQIGWRIYRISGRTLEDTNLDTFCLSSGYFIASLKSVIEEEGLNRNFFHVYPIDLNVIEGSVIANKLVINKYLSSGSLIVHGPYTFLPKGFYRMTINGTADSSFSIDVTEQFGSKVTRLEFDPNKLVVEFPVNLNLCKFELVIRSLANGIFSASISSIKLEKIG